MRTNTDFPAGHTPLSQEARTILSIRHVESGAYHYTVGRDGVEKIVAYDENGDMAHVPWLAVLNREGVWLRMPASGMAVFYQ